MGYIPYWLDMCVIAEEAFHCPPWELAKAPSKWKHIGAMYMEYKSFMEKIKNGEDVDTNNAVTTDTTVT